MAPYPAISKAIGITTQKACESLRPQVAQAATWRLLSELWRRHDADHALRLIHTHPGASQRGQVCMLLDPKVGRIMTCLRLALNLGGPTGTYEVHAEGNLVATGEYLWPTLTDDPKQLLLRLERDIGLRAPAALQPSTPPVLAMRLVAELLTATCLDQFGLVVETAWFDWGGGVRIMDWASHFGHDLRKIQPQLDSGQLDWQKAYLDVASLLRVAPADDNGATRAECLLDLQSGRVLVKQPRKEAEILELPQAYVEHSRRLEPLAARCLSALRSQN